MLKTNAQLTPFMLAGVFIALLLPHVCYAQEGAEKEEEGRHRIAVIIGHAHVPTGIKENGKKGMLAVPGWGLDYDYRLSAKWAVGLHSDIANQNFAVARQFKDERTIERTKPVSVTLVGIYKPGKHLSIVFGGGAELAKEGNFAMARLGLEYGWELPEEWELGISLMNDLKIDEYNSWVLGLGVGKFF